MDITLNLFSNCVQSTPNNYLISKTLNSWLSTFNVDIENLDINLFIDPSPNPGRWTEYASNCEKLLKDAKSFNIIKTTGLADGYAKSIVMSKTDVIFQLEHDWVFLKERIHHSLQDLAIIMKTYAIEHLRFNKRENIVIKWDKELKEVVFDKVVLCRTVQRSNNPHLILREKYIEYLPLIRARRKGSYGIEEELFDVGYGYIYGGTNYPKTIKHIDGVTFKDLIISQSN